MKYFLYEASAISFVAEMDFSFYSSRVFFVSPYFFNPWLSENHATRMV